MWTRVAIALLFAGLASFPADTARTLQERYGLPISEIYVVRLGIEAWARYGASGHVCAMVVKPERAEHPLNRRENNVGDYERTVEILKELVPEKERGKYKGATLLHLACAPAEMPVDCGGVEEEWEKLVIKRNGNNDHQHYATIRWKRDECHDIYPDVN
ncbi:MAG: hypothetical protein ABSD39_05745 [Terriglobales bacterium]